MTQDNSTSLIDEFTSADGVPLKEGMAVFYRVDNTIVWSIIVESRPNSALVTANGHQVWAWLAWADVNKLILHVMKEVANEIIHHNESLMALSNFLAILSSSVLPAN